ncbi:MAG: hypothetical protein KAJ36_00925 [Candidatus Thorarchaeota archaeon]|nr:hypothetical protein [Candidatus Thorarchaeota archaeon]
MSGSETEEENILGHLHAAMKMVTAAHHQNLGLSTAGENIEPEYACLRTMMLEPRNPTMWNSLALVYLMTGQYENAKDSIENSLDLDSSIAWTWSIWGDLFSLVGNEIESKRAYRMAIEMDSSNEK